MKEILYAMLDAVEDVIQQSGDVAGVKIMAPMYLEQHILDYTHANESAHALITIDTATRVIEFQGIRIHWGYENDIVIYHHMWPIVGAEPHRIPVKHMNKLTKQLGLDNLP